MAPPAARFPSHFARRELELWSRLNQTTDLSRLGGHSFQTLARIIGPVSQPACSSGCETAPDSSCQTMTESAVADLLAKIPGP
jgi:hypothetical protein